MNLDVAIVIGVGLCIGSVVTGLLIGFLTIVKNSQIVAEQAVYQSNVLKYIADLLYTEATCSNEPDDDPDGGEPIPEASNVVDLRQAA